MPLSVAAVFGRDKLGEFRRTAFEVDCEPEDGNQINCLSAKHSVLDVEYYLRVAQEHNVKVEVSPRSSSVPIFGQVRVY